MYNFSYKKNFGKKIIFDNAGSNIFFKYLNFSKNEYFVYKTVPRTIYFNFPIIIQFIKLLINNGRFRNYQNLKYLHFIYLISFFKTVDPKIVITYAYDSNLYLTIVKNFKNLNFLAIQNGYRLPGEYLNNKYYFKFYLSWGTHEEKLFKKYKVKCKKILPIGSIAADYYFKKYKNIKKKYDFCLIEQTKRTPEWLSNHIKNDKKYNFHLNNFNEKQETFFSYFARYLQKNKFKVVVAIRGKKKDTNLQLLKKHFKNLVVFKETTKPNDVYKLISQSEMVVGFPSSVIRECWGFEKKSIAVDFFNSEVFSTFKNNFLAIKKKNYNYFEKRLDELKKMSDLEYSKKLSKYKKIFMCNDKNIPVEKILKKKLVQILDNKIKLY